jgi:hypothetical protein
VRRATPGASARTSFGPRVYAGRRTVEDMSSDHRTDTDPYAEHPEESIFPGAGRRVSDEEREAALDAGVHQSGLAEVAAEQVEGDDQAD